MNEEKVACEIEAGCAWISVGGVFEFCDIARSDERRRRQGNMGGGMAGGNMGGGMVR